MTNESEAKAVRIPSGLNSHGQANPLLKPVLIAAGTVSVGVGVLGIFLPLLPTTPFLLFAAACYARSSERLYRWLHENRWFGAYLTHYRAGRGLPMSAKLVTIAILWIAIGGSILVVDMVWLRILLLVIAAGVTAHLAFMKTPNTTHKGPPSSGDAIDHSAS